MWGAIVSLPEKTWFFKVTGPNGAVSARAPDFQEFVQSIHFHDGTPEWELPDGWSRRPPDQFRFATLEIAADETAAQLEMSVSQLATPPGDDQRYLLQNVNRWRGQLGLGSLSDTELDANSTSIGMDDAKGLVVEFAGTLAASGRSMANAGRPAAARQSRTNRPPPAPKISYQQPDGWQTGDLVKSRGGVSIPRSAAFVVEEGADQIEITVTSLPARGGDEKEYVTANVNRWRGQLRLQPLASDKLEFQPINFAGLEASYVEIIGQHESILGVVAVNDDRAWFTKLQGAVDLAIRERERFKEFVHSIQFKD